MKILQFCCIILLELYFAKSTHPPECTCHEIVWSCKGKQALNSEDMCHHNISRVFFSDNNFTSIPVNVPESVIEMYINDNQLTSLPRPPQIPSGLNVLDVSGNMISETSDELQTLTSLTVLYIERNDISSLGFLPTPCGLEEVSAGNNAIPDIEPLLQCTRLRLIDLNNNQLSSLNSGSFQNMTNLRQLYLRKNKLTSVPSKAFSGSSALISLYLESNEIASVESDTFAGVPELRMLLLSRNLLSDLPENVFAGLPQLALLALDGNRLAVLENEVRSHFAGLSNLRVLDIGNNSLKEIPDTAFVGLNGLNSLTLSKNALVTLSSSALNPLERLGDLYVAENMLTSVPEKGSWMNKLESLYMNGNKLETLSDGMLDGAGSLKIFSCTNNSIHKINKNAFSGLRSLMQLNLEDNLLQEFDMSVFENGIFPAFVYLQNNKLTALPKYTLQQGRRGMRVFLSNNSITEVDEGTLRSWLESTAKARILDLQGNRIRTPATLQWVLEDTEIEKVVDENRKSCGKLKRGKALVKLCFDIPEADDPSSSDTTPADWVEAIRTGWSRSQ